MCGVSFSMLIPSSRKQHRAVSTHQRRVGTDLLWNAQWVSNLAKGEHPALAIVHTAWPRRTGPCLPVRCAHVYVGSPHFPCSRLRLTVAPKNSSGSSTAISASSEQTLRDANVAVRYLIAYSIDSPKARAQLYDMLIQSGPCLECRVIAVCERGHRSVRLSIGLVRPIVKGSAHILRLYLCVVYVCHFLTIIGKRSPSLAASTCSS